jgi:hypothetical protein
LQFSEAEFQAIQNQSFFKVKATALEKIEQQFAEIVNEMEIIYSQHATSISFAPKKVFSKISRGENLNQLPFLILDFPKQFSKSEVFSFRLLFWWGKGFTLFLHLKNDKLESIVEKVLNNADQLLELNTLFSTQGDEWNHDVASENYQTLTSVSTTQKIDFVKFAWPLPFNQNIELKEFTKHRMSLILNILSQHE